MASRPSQLIIVLVAVLLAVIAGSGVVLWFFTNNQPNETLAPLTGDTVPTGTTAPANSPVSDATFNTTVLRSSRYTALDVQLVTDGSLPVQPPAVVGKANPFL